MSTARAAPNRYAGSFPGGFRTPALVHMPASVVAGIRNPSQKTTFLFNVEDMASSWASLGQRPLEPRQNLEEVTDEAVIGHLEDRRLFVLVDRHDDLRSPHARVLDGPGDSDRDGEIGCTLPVWPTYQSLGAQLAATAAHEALIAAPRSARPNQTARILSPLNCDMSGSSVASTGLDRGPSHLRPPPERRPCALRSPS